MDDVEGVRDGGDVGEGAEEEEFAEAVRLAERGADEGGGEVGAEVVEGAAEWVAGEEEEDGEDWLEPWEGKEFSDWCDEEVVVDEGKAGAGEDFVDAQMRGDRVVDVPADAEGGDGEGEDRKQLRPMKR